MTKLSVGFLFSMILALVLLFWLSSCNRRSLDESGKQIFRYNESAGISTLDPAFAKDLPHIWACNQLYNGLVALDEELTIIPAIAKSWTIDSTALIYTFILRDDIYFHESEVFDNKTRIVTAHDFVYSFNRLLAPGLSSPGTWIFNQVAKSHGNYAFNALNDTTLEIRLSSPFPAFLGVLAMTYASVVPKEAVESYGAAFRNKPVGTGPFRFQYWKEGVKLVLRKNPDYFEQENGSQLPYIDAVSISFLIDRQTAFLEFIKENLDFMSGIDARYKDELLSRDGQLRSKYSDRIQLIRQPYLNTEYLGIFIGDDQSVDPHHPLLDKSVRQAMSYGIDRQKMLRFLRNGIGVPGHAGMIPFGMPGHDSIGQSGYSYNQAKARELLAGSGFEKPQITITTTADYVDIIKFVQSQLNDIGFDARIEVSPAASMREMRAQGKLQIFRASWVADYPDAENYLSLFTTANFTPAGPNYTHFSNAVFDELYHKALSETDPVKRNSLYASMDSLMMTDAPVVVLYYDEVLRFVNKRVKGLGSNPVNMLDLKRVRL
jgi:ABC-type transport system substrate-binding protein